MCLLLSLKTKGVNSLTAGLIHLIIFGCIVPIKVASRGAVWITNNYELLAWCDEKVCLSRKLFVTLNCFIFVVTTGNFLLMTVKSGGYGRQLCFNQELLCGMNSLADKRDCELVITY